MHSDIQRKKFLFKLKILIMKEPITSLHCVGFQSWNYASLLRNGDPFFKLENALLVRKQVTDGSLQLPQLGAIKERERERNTVVTKATFFSSQAARLHKGSHRGHLAPVGGKNMWIKVTGGRDFNFTKICKGKERKGWGRKKDYLQRA